MPTNTWTCCIQKKFKFKFTKKKKKLAQYDLFLTQGEIRSFRVRLYSGFLTET